jgi:hypothetical protein
LPEILADVECDKDVYPPRCRQDGRVPPELRATAIRELRERGLAEALSRGVFFTVWRVPATPWSLVEADYEEISGSIASISEVILLVGPAANVTVVRAVPFQRTNADVPSTTEWEMVDLVDIDGDGQPELVLEGDAYEDHWLEVVRISDGSAKTVFSGLGYWL